jgi:Flp pilus assembly protein TadD
MCLCACGLVHKSKKEMLEHRAFYAYDHDNYWEAGRLLDSLIVLDSTKGEYYFKRAYCYGRVDDARALDDYMKAIKLNYNVAGAYKNIGFEALQDGTDSLAVVFFSRAIRADPTKSNELTPWIESCQQRIASHDADAWKKLQERKKGIQQRPTMIKVKK